MNKQDKEKLEEIKKKLSQRAEQESKDSLNKMVDGIFDTWQDLE